MSLQIFVSVDGQEFQPMRKFDIIDSTDLCEHEAIQTFQMEESDAQASADAIRKPISIELRNNESGRILMHKRFLPTEFRHLQ